MRSGSTQSPFKKSLSSFDLGVSNDDDWVAARVFPLIDACFDSEPGSSPSYDTDLLAKGLTAVVGFQVTVLDVESIGVCTKGDDG